ncbi:glutamine-hydrolyzing carbamoyl-phosphate synthase small subunit [uncultured Helicobacter sp.]|uniref:glutamine-hydrolyzing carbamoyl-phosphate synthase small subunit n=1 Tax=uncultured Helicobacter sp. TaxID=175537 RepID=UPI00374E930A
MPDTSPHHDLKPISLYFENGVFLQAKSFGAEGSAVGEVVFNTSLSGYEEIITDPSYAGQFITFSMPEIGIVGVNPQDEESTKTFCKGVIVANYNEFYSNFRATQSLGDFLKAQNIIGICGVDTRALIKMLTKQGSMMMIASTHIHDAQSLATQLASAPHIQDINYIKQVSTPTPYTHQDSVFSFESLGYTKPQWHKKILAIDFGIKRNILNELNAVGLEVEVIPYTFSADEVLERFERKEIGGVFLSNGPGDPLVLKDEVAQIQKLINANIPIFGICLGHQLLAIAHGFETFKLKFGHHGGNHPVKNLITQEVEITAQNHNYSVPDSIESIAQVTHRNLFDGTIEGLKYHNKPIFSVQHHPEASPGPKEARRLFAEFATIVRETL